MITSPATGTGAQCEAEDGAAGLCLAGDGLCPPDQDCVGAWSACGTDCAPSTYEVSTPATGNGAPCEIVAGSTRACTDCAARDCVGAWSICASDCSPKRYVVSTHSVGGGAACPSADGATLACSPGEGNCPANTDCVGAWGTCAADCRERYLVSTAASGNGQGCAAAHGTERACSSGHGNCPAQCSVPITFPPSTRKARGDCGATLAHGDSCNLGCATGYTAAGTTVCNNGALLSSMFCMQVPAGATRVPATTSLDGAVSQEVFVSGAQSANGGATVAVTSYEMTCDLELRLDVPASQLGLGSAGRTQFKAGVASAAGVAPNQVVVNTVSDARRRLQTGRALVDYTITAPVDVSDAVSGAGYSQALVVRSRSHFPFSSSVGSSHLPCGRSTRQDGINSAGTALDTLTASGVQSQGAPVITTTIAFDVVKPEGTDTALASGAAMMSAINSAATSAGEPAPLSAAPTVLASTAVPGPPPGPAPSVPVSAAKHHVRPDVLS